MATQTIQDIRDEIEATLAKNKAIAIEALETAKLKGQLELVSDVKYVQRQVETQNKLQTIVKLKAKLAALNDLPTIRLPKGERVKVNVFQTGRSYFGEEVSYVLGIAMGLNGLFMDQHVLLGYSTIGTNTVTIERIQEAFGRTAYYSNKTASVSPQIMGNFFDAKQALVELARDMNMDIDLSKFTREAYLAYFENEKIKAERRAADIALGVVVTNTPNSAGAGKLLLTPQGAEA